MKRYEKYKDSGIAWIGEIPEHWDSCAIKRISKVTTGSTPPTGNSSYFESEDIDWFTPSDFDESNIRLFNSNRKLSNNVLNDKLIKLYPPQSVLVIGIGGTLGRIGYSAEVCYSNQQINAISLCNKFHSLYYAYSMSVIKSYIWANANTATMPILNQTATKNLFVAVPKLEEQAKIAKYLDWKCGEVDKIVAMREEQIKLLGELRTSVISRAVTKGLNPDAPLKDSSIPWIGSIPAHWEVVDLKFVFNYVVGFTPDTKNEKFYCDGTENWITIADLDNKEVSASKTKLTELAIATYRKPLVKKGALMYSFKLSVGKVAFAGIDTYTNEAIFSIQPEDKQDLRFYYYSLPLLLIHNANENIYGAPIMNQELIKNSAVRKPPLAEQQAIADYLDKKTAEIDSAVAKYKEQIAKLKEYRRALITEVVTGKIDVRDVVIPTQSNQASNQVSN